MNADDLRAKTIDELSKVILDLRKEQFNARFQKTQGTMEKTDGVRRNRRTIARVKTVLNEKRRAEAQASANKAA